MFLARFLDDGAVGVGIYINSLIRQLCCLFGLVEDDN
jgi:hypothetical protein